MCARMGSPPSQMTGATSIAGTIRFSDTPACGTRGAMLASKTWVGRVGERMGDPRDRPGIQERVAEVVDGGSHPRRLRPRHANGHGREKGRDQDEFLHRRIIGSP